MDIFKDTLISFLISFIKEKNKINIEPKEAEKLIKLPPDNSYGDYSVASYYLAKHGFKGKPEDVALEFLNYARVNFAQIKDFFGKMEIKGPYVNFFVHKEKFIGVTVKNVLKHGGDYGRGHLNKAERVVIDFSSPNIAKPFGVGHLRSTVIGMSLANIYEFCGYNVIKINYLGDFGTQFGKLITAFCRYYKDIDFSELGKTPVKVLYNLYVRIHKEAEGNEAIEQDARDRFKKLEGSLIKKQDAGLEDFLKSPSLNSGVHETALGLSGQPSKISLRNVASFCEKGDEEGQYILWEDIRNLSIKEFKRIYKLMGIEFDVYEGEAESAIFSGEIVKILLESGLAAESEEAIIIPLKDIKTPALIAKSDGTSLYLSRDVVTAVLRMAKYGYDRMIYVVGSEQSLHFSQLFNIFDILKERKDALKDNPVFQKYASSVSGKLAHVKFGRIIGMSTRKGNLVFLEDYIGEAKAKAMEKIIGVTGEGKLKLNIQDIEEAALKIGLGAVIFNDLKTRRNTDVNFNWDNVLSFEGQTGPYLQYTVSRINSLIARLTDEKGNGIKDAATEAYFDKEFSISSSDNDFNELFLIAKQISIFKDNIEGALNLNEPSIISSYVLELASLFNKYYQNYRLLGRDSEYIKPRLYLLMAIKAVLTNALKLLCIPILERM